MSDQKTIVKHQRKISSRIRERVRCSERRNKNIDTEWWRYDDSDEEEQNFDMDIWLERQEEMNYWDSFVKKEK